MQLLDPDAEASVVVVRRLLAAMGVPLDADVARCIYAGLVTDTSSFITAGESAHRLAAELVAAGVDARAAGALADVHPPVRLARRARSGAAGGGAGAGGGRRAGAGAHRGAVVDVDRFRTEDVDSVVDMVRTTTEAEVAAVLQAGRPRRAGSPRCAPTGRIDVATVASRLGGGGHPGAAGFTWEGTRDELLVRCGPR